MRISLAEISNYINAQLLSGNTAGHYVSGAAVDSRKVTPGGLFFAVEGDNTDGHMFVEAAAQAGACAAVVEKDIHIPADFTVLKVNNTKNALLQCSKMARQNFLGYVVAVTGSNGKTTTKDMIANVLSGNFNTEKTFANYNNEIGLPLTILNCPDEKQALVLEMGMRARGEISLLADIAQPHVGVITNIGVAHMELLKSQENIALAKFELISVLKQQDTAVLNADDEWCVSLAPSLCKVLFYGFGEKADVRCTDMQITAQGTSFEVSFYGESFKVFLPTWGKHNISNALAAIAVGISLGMDPLLAAKGLSTYQPSPMRLEIKTGKTGFSILDDAYNANPVSAAASLEVLASITDKRKIAVLGEMYELGEMEVEGHKEVGRKAQQYSIDLLITVGKKAAKIAEGALENGMDPRNIYVFDDKKAATEFLLNIICSEDTVLIKGSRGMHMENIVTALM